ncbi:MAG: hypothetical protein IIB00_07560, partial [candidate division Zixibacteria bacterium]|nr:hypothetical protein [candidate division Zixibacteria bacterium]
MMDRFRNISALIALAFVFTFAIGIYACDGGPGGFVVPTPEGILNSPSQLTLSGQ